MVVAHRSGICSPACLAVFGLFGFSEGLFTFVSGLFVDIGSQVAQAGLKCPMYH